MGLQHGGQVVGRMGVVPHLCVVHTRPVIQVLSELLVVVLVEVLVGLGLGLGLGVQVQWRLGHAVVGRRKGVVGVVPCVRGVTRVLGLEPKVAVRAAGRSHPQRQGQRVWYGVAQEQGVGPRTVPCSRPTRPLLPCWHHGTRVVVPTLTAKRMM